MFRSVLCGNPQERVVVSCKGCEPSAATSRQLIPIYLCPATALLNYIGIGANACVGSASPETSGQRVVGKPLVLKSEPEQLINKLPKHQRQFFSAGEQHVCPRLDSVAIRCSLWSCARNRHKAELLAHRGGTLSGGRIPIVQTHKYATASHLPACRVSCEFVSLRRSPTDSYG